MSARFPSQDHGLHDGEEDPAAPSVTLIYEDAESGHRAAHTLKLLTADSAGGSTVVSHQLWRFDLLEDPVWFGLALADAINSDVVLVSSRGGKAFPTTVERWLKTCLARLRGTDAAIVALAGTSEHADAPDSPQLRLLQMAAADAGLSFFTPESGKMDLMPENLESIAGRVEAMTPTLDGILHSPAKLPFEPRVPITIIPLPSGSFRPPPH